MTIEINVYDLDSKNIKAIEFRMTDSSIPSKISDNSEGDLHVTFQAGSIYIYEKVPIGVVFELFRGGSVGKKFNESIAYKYKYTKVQ